MLQATSRKEAPATPAPRDQGQGRLFGSAPEPLSADALAEALPDAPLAARMRPRTLEEVVGQEEAIGPGTPLRRALERNQLPSLIFWGPPGSGKTTLARLVAQSTGAQVLAVSAVAAGVADLRRAAELAAQALRQGRRTVLFIDELHRFSKAQQDIVLPHVESGLLRLLGATTEHPGFGVIAPLLSRCRVVVLKPLDRPSLRTILSRALTDGERGLGGLGLTVDPEALDVLVEGAGQDARTALNLLELAAAAVGPGGRVDRAVAAAVVGRPHLLHDREGDRHYDLISAFIKSVRGSDADAALYWLARMLEGGEDPLFVVRRMVILAAEDVGLADPLALPMATACLEAVRLVGLPEGYLPMAECALYLALAPKSNSALTGYQAAREAVRTTLNLPVPLHLRNAVTGLDRQLGVAEGYRYAHDLPEGVAHQTYLPSELAQARFFTPGGRGAEAELARRWQSLRQLLGRGEAAGPAQDPHPEGNADPGAKKG